MQHHAIRNGFRITDVEVFGDHFDKGRIPQVIVTEDGSKVQVTKGKK
jgi:hypothetical protein